MNKSRDKLAREWALNFYDDATMTTHQHVEAALEFILENTEGKVQGRHEEVVLPFASVADTSDHAQLPRLANSQDAGLDLYVSREVVIQPGEFVDVPCGLAAQLPPMSWGLLTGRSSTFRKHRLLVINGVIDEGYRGELFAGVVNLDNEPVVVQQGQRLAQLIVIPRMANFAPKLVGSLDEGERGDQGFGSSGN